MIFVVVHSLEDTDLFSYISFQCGTTLILFPKCAVRDGSVERRQEKQHVAADLRTSVLLQVNVMLLNFWY
jgi:hypothetical protein